MSRQSDTHTLVIDIGMTNKKITVFDACCNEVEFESISFPPQKRDGFMFHDLEKIENWVLQFTTFFLAKYPIGKIGISTHGATFVLLNEHGDYTIPPILYTTPMSSEMYEEYDNLVGGEGRFDETSTSNMPDLLEAGKAFYFYQKYFEKEWNTTKMILAYPQYFFYILTGEQVVEKSYIGSHSGLWNFKKQVYSSVFHSLHLDKIWPKRIVTPTYSVEIRDEFKKDAQVDDIKVFCGIHDSTVTMWPLLKEHKKKPIIMLSTGTWILGIGVMVNYIFTDRDKQDGVFYNSTLDNRPVKVGMFMGGLYYQKVIDALQKDVDVTWEDIQTVASQKTSFIELKYSEGLENLRIVLQGKHITLDEVKLLSECQNKEIKSALILSLVCATFSFLENLNVYETEALYIDGVFTKNKEYLRGLASLLNENVMIKTAVLDNGASVGTFSLLNEHVDVRYKVEDYSSNFSQEIHDYYKIFKKFK